MQRLSVLQDSSITDEDKRATLADFVLIWPASALAIEVSPQSASSQCRVMSHHKARPCQELKRE
jgi:hypothetical protein